MAVFAEIAKRMNVPEKCILKEDKAENTFENARLSKKVVAEMGIKISRAILVCKSFHARRALLTYQAEFGTDIEYLVCPIIDERNITKSNWYREQGKIERVMSEVERIGKYFAAHIARLVC